MDKNILIIEDEEVSKRALVDVAQKCAPTSVIYWANNSAMAYKYALENRIDLFLVDIVLEKNNPSDISGIKFAEEIRNIEKYKFTPIIFVTALEDYAMSAFHRLHCYGYIEKPFDFKQVCSIIKDALEYPLQTEKKRQYFYYRKNGILYSIDKDTIFYLEMINRKLIAHTDKENIEIPYHNCEQIIKELGEEDFLRCNRSTIVNRMYIENIDEANCYVKLRSGDILEIGRVLKKKFLKELKR